MELSETNQINLKPELEGLKMLREARINNQRQMKIIERQTKSTTMVQSRSYG